MNLKASLFSKAVIKSDLKRYWWAAALEFVLLLLGMLQNMDYYYEDIKTADTFILNYTDNGVLTGVFAFVLAGLLFSYLHKPNSAACMHGLPISRTSQWFSHLITGYAIIIVPVVLYSFISGIAFGNYAAHSIKWTLMYLYADAVFAAVIFTLVSFVSTIVGNIAVAYIFSLGLMLLPAYLYDTIELLLENFLIGFCEQGFVSKWLEKYVYISFEMLIGKRSLIYILYSIIFIVLGFIFYKKRDLENCNEVVAFNFLKPVFMYIAAYCFGSLAFIGIEQNGPAVIISFIVGAIAVTAAFMLNRKSISFKGILKYYIVYFIMYGLIFAVFAIDFTGFQTRIPDISNIEGAELTDYSDSSVKLTVDEIEMLNNMHKNIVKSKTESRFTNDNDWWTTVEFKYNLNGGKEMYRSYHLTFDEILENREFFESSAYAEYKNPSFRDDVKKINEITITKYEPSENDKEIIITDGRLNEIFNSLKKDEYNMKAEERWEYYEYFEPEGGEDEISYSIDIEYLYTNNENETQLGYDGFSLSKYHKDTLELAEKYFQE